jgi:hypothetical protein
MILRGITPVLFCSSMDKILERYERYSYAEKALISAESESEVRIMGWVSTFICHISFFSATDYDHWHQMCVHHMLIYD